MNDWERVLFSIINPDESFGDVFIEALNGLNMSISSFASESSVSESMLYKITSGHRKNIQMDNFREIVITLKRLEQGRERDERAVALISNRESLEPVRERISIDGYEVSLRPYPSSTVEEAIRQSILAERDGVDAIICGPITAYTIENIVYTPVIGLDISHEQVHSAVELAIEKTAGTGDEN